MVSAALSSGRGLARMGTLLVELMLGLTLVSLTIMAIFQLFPAADSSVGLADRATQANYIARNLMEDKLGLSYGNLSTAPEDQEEGDIALQHTSRRGQNLSTTFHYRVEVSQPDASKQLKRIVVTVGWPRGSTAAQETVRLECEKTTLW